MAQHVQSWQIFESENYGALGALADLLKLLPDMYHCYETVGEAHQP